MTLRDVGLWLVGNLVWAGLVWSATALYRRMWKQRCLYWPTVAGVTLSTIAATTGAIFGSSFDSGDPVLARIAMGACLVCLLLYAVLGSVEVLLDHLLTEPPDFHSVAEPVWIAAALASQVVCLYIIVAVGRGLMSVAF